MCVYVFTLARVRACIKAFTRVCVRTCVYVCVCVCLHGYMQLSITTEYEEMFKWAVTFSLPKTRLLVKPEHSRREKNGAVEM